jgi:hypothetical protein
MFAEMCVKAVLAVADMEHKDVNLDLIKVESKVCRFRTAENPQSCWDWLSLSTPRWA